VDNEVTNLLNALHDGSMTIDEVARKFRERNWPRRQRPLPGNYEEMARTEIQDPDHYIPGSYDDVAAAYHSGRLTDAQYTTLITAIADAKAEEDEKPIDT
jgi:hypothetical protein